MADPTLAELLHRETWLSHGLPPEAICGYCESAAARLVAAGVRVGTPDALRSRRHAFYSERIDGVDVETCGCCGLTRAALAAPRDEAAPFYCVVCGVRLLEERQFCAKCEPSWQPEPRAEAAPTPGCSLHMHVAGRSPGDLDTCHECGHDLRALCHVRLTEAPTPEEPHA